MKAMLRILLRDEAGLTMVEYAVGGGFIITVAVAAIRLVGGNLADALTSLANAF